MFVHCLVLSLVTIQWFFYGLQPSSLSLRHLATFPNFLFPVLSCASTNSMREERAAFSKVRGYREDPQCLVFSTSSCASTATLKGGSAKFLENLTFIHQQKYTTYCGIQQNSENFRQIFTTPSSCSAACWRNSGRFKDSSRYFCCPFCWRFSQRPAAPRASYRQGLEAVGVGIASPESELYNVQFSLWVKDGIISLPWFPPGGRRHP